MANLKQTLRKLGMKLDFLLSFSTHVIRSIYSPSSAGQVAHPKPSSYYIIDVTHQLCSAPSPVNHVCRCARSLPGTNLHQGKLPSSERRSKEERVPQRQRRRQLPQHRGVPAVSSAELLRDQDRRNDCPEVGIGVGPSTYLTTLDC